MKGLGALLAVALLVLGGGEARGHSRTRREPPPLPAASAPRPEAPPCASPEPAPLSSEEELLRRYHTLPGSAEGPSLLLQLARLARRQGQVEKARWAFGLVARLHPESEAARQARRERLLLDFARDLADLPPLVACRLFLGRLGQDPAAFQDPAVRLALRQGWQAVAAQGGREMKLAPAVAAEVLELWDLHPPGAPPPEARLLLARLLGERGIWKEARELLEGVLREGEESLTQQALIHLLELAWSEQGVTGFLATLARLHASTPGVPEALRAWFLRLEGSGASADSPEGALGALRPEVRLQLWEELSSQPLPAALAVHLLRDLAALQTAGEVAPRAARLSQALLEKTREELGPGYYFDRVGLNHLRLRQWQAAQEAFQALAQDQDPLWQQVGRVRLTEVELAQLHSEGSR